MKTLHLFSASANVRTIKSAASKLMDFTIPQDLSALYDFLCPQWIAGHMGLKKLVEKDYLSQDEEISFLNNAMI